MNFATFYLSDDSRRYTLTMRDVEWLAKALYQESNTEKSRIACAYAMIQRFMRWPGGKWSSFTDFLRAFSQPINPIWADPTTAKCMQYPELCTSEAVARRRKIQNWTWEEIPRDLQEIAVTFASGKYANPVPNSVNFSSKARVEKLGKKGVTIGGNTFLDASQDSMQGWKKASVLRIPLAKIPDGLFARDFKKNPDFLKLFFFAGALIILYSVSKGQLPRLARGF